MGQLEDMFILGGGAGVDSFISLLMKDLDLAIRELEADPQSYAGANENLLTRIIVSFLKGRFYHVSSDTHERGHVDLLVECSRLNLRWCGEAKKHSGYDTALEGMRQLLTRYASGFDPRGGFFLYCFAADAANVCATWKDTLRKDAGCRTINIADESPLRFESRHAHDQGTQYSIRHHIVILHFSPQDKSGRKRRAKVPP